MEGLAEGFEAGAGVFEGGDGDADLRLTHGSEGRGGSEGWGDREGGGIEREKVHVRSHYY